MNPEAKLNKLVVAHPFLAGLKPQAHEIFCGCASLQRYDKGQIIFQEGGKADYFYLIESGQVVLDVSVPGQEMVTIQAVGPGEALGWSWLFPPYQWHFSATAIKPTKTIAFAAERLREHAQQNQEFSFELLQRLARVMAGRLADLRTRLIYSYQAQL
jgi:CRP/FNR family cyclic AMP-dependent transcriptional regulator